MSNLSDLLPAGAGAKSADFVATGTLSSGQTVALKTDGTVEAISVIAANKTDFVGITDEAISSAATGAVIVQGGVSGKVTGLTIGSDYYVQDDGTVTTVTSTVPAGRALSATSILLEG